MSNNPFAKFSNDGLEKAKDTLGGGGFIKDSDLYKGAIREFYATQSESGSMFAHFTIEMADGSKYSDRVCVAGKSGDNFYLNKQDPTKKVPLPGYLIAEHMAQIAVGKSLNELDFQTKTITQRNFDTKKDEHVDVQMAVEMLGKVVELGVLKIRTNKKGPAPDYALTNEEKFENETDKVFHPEYGITVVEAENEISEPLFRKGWLERNKGQIRDKFKEVKGAGAAGAPQRPTPSGGAAAGGAPARKSLFPSKSA